MIGTGRCGVIGGGYDIVASAIVKRGIVQIQCGVV